MKHEEAIDVVGMIAAHWPGNVWSVASMEAYSNGIQGWDADATMKAVSRAVQECDFYPKVSVLREFYRIEKRLAEPESPIQRMLNDTPSQLMPAWVRGYVVSRVRYKDMRVWPEQKHLVDGEPMPSDVCNAYMSEGADLPVEQLFQTMIGNV